jgi:hypothetical protein
MRSRSVRFSLALAGSWTLGLIGLRAYEILFDRTLGHSGVYPSAVLALTLGPIGGLIAAVHLVVVLRSERKDWPGQTRTLLGWGLALASCVLPWLFLLFPFA